VAWDWSEKVNLYEEVLISP